MQNTSIAQFSCDCDDGDNDNHLKKKAPKQQLQTIVLIKFMLNTDLFTKSMKCPYRVFYFPLKKG